MNQDDFTRLVSLYRANATEQPDARLDAAILKASRRGKHPYGVAVLFGALVIAIGVMTLESEKPVERPLISATSQTSPRPGMEDGRQHFLAATAEPMRIGMNVQPQLGEGLNQSGGE